MTHPLFRLALAFRRARKDLRRLRGFRPALERLEDRTVPTVLSPTAHVLDAGGAAPAGGPGQPAGFSPGQIQTAYGFNQITFQNGTVRGDGSGQTIAIVDAYDQPNIASNLSTFDAMYGIAAPPSFTKVNESGGTSYPTADTSWGVEISLDVEWAHAIAPGAGILLVEASSNSWSDLVTAVNYARQQAGVAVVSMSFGGPEWTTETSYDGYFTTPAGHGGVTFVASTGDNGAGTEFPSISPNVLAVGGTQLTTDVSGNYQGETGWSGSGGGISAYEAQPAYQKGVVTQSSTMRAAPDVAYDGSSSSPFAVYDTSGYGGWIQVYGTSAGAPQWAALVAIADQGRALLGKGALDGPSQTLPMLYQLSGSDFHDITTGSNGAYSAGVGYDLVTGRGTPVANLVVSDLVGTQTISTTNQAPTVTTPARATPNPVTGTTTNLSVLGSDADGDALTYTWSVTAAPSGSNTTFSANGTAAAANATAKFSMAGSYTFTVTIADAGGLTATSSVTVAVSQTLTRVTVTPGSTSLGDGGSQQFAAVARDQFGNAMSTQPGFSWSLSGLGAVSGGMYYAPTSGSGTASVQASASGMAGAASVTFGSVPAAPSNLNAAAVSSREIDLSWTDNAGNETGFIVQRSTNGSSWSQIATVGAGATTYADTTVNKHHTYYYRVCAYNSFGDSAFSNATNGVTPHDGVGPRGDVVGQALLTVPSLTGPQAGPVTVAVRNAGSGQSGSVFVSSAGKAAAPLPTYAGNVDVWTASHGPSAAQDAFWLLWAEDLTQNPLGGRLH